ncbi:MAG: FMN-binding negative transcriptional regulator [Pseudomonadota bacterium]|nr:FMN-binding negative transcriptional regulator [Pseudomonadota bacterium]
MYLPGHFAESRPAVLQQLMREHPFGLLVTQGNDGLAANSLPFIYDAADDAHSGERGMGLLRSHVARANPVWQQARTDAESLVVFQGPQTYVSPAWYPSKAEHGKVVPTWNYVMVQARGRLRVIEDSAWLRSFVSRLTDRHERDRLAQDAAGAPAWAASDAPADYLERMLQAIVGIEIEVTQLIGKWKVSQNRSAADREGVVHGLAGVPGSDAAAMAALLTALAGAD